MHYDLNAIRTAVAAENQAAATLIDVLLVGLQGIELRPGQLMYALGQLTEKIPHDERHLTYSVLLSHASTRWQEPSSAEDDMWKDYGEYGRTYVWEKGDDAVQSIETFLRILNYAYATLLDTLNDIQSRICADTQADLERLLPETDHNTDIAA